MGAKVISLTDYQRSRPERRRLKIAKCRDILSLCDARRLKKSKVASDRLKGLGYAYDHLVGPDEPTEDSYDHYDECYNLDDNVPLQCSQCYMFSFNEKTDSVGGVTLTCTNCGASIYYPPDEKDES